MASPKAVLQTFAKDEMLVPGASPDEILAFEKQMPGKLPEEVKELLVYSFGVNLPQGEIRFRGIEGYEFPEVVPQGIALLADEKGNFWIVDVDPGTGAWGVVFYISHDPPVALIQAPDLATFLKQLMDPGEVGAAKLATDAASEIWKRDPWLKAPDSEKDPEILDFVKSLPPNFHIADLRSKETGSGFSWGRAGPDSEIRRNGNAFIFGVRQKAKGPLRRLFGG
jgi:cell wall assembly regulator SMI1